MSWGSRAMGPPPATIPTPTSHWEMMVFSRLAKLMSQARVISLPLPVARPRIRAIEATGSLHRGLVDRREIDVWRLIGGGNSNKQIAGQLSIGEATVKSHVTNILSKLSANDRAHAVTIGLKRGIIEL
jgi:DNA-binding NarL/FixJ family response regulator